MQQYSELASFAENRAVSAGTGDNVDRLERVIIDRLPEGGGLSAGLPDGISRSGFFAPKSSGRSSCSSPQQRNPVTIHQEQPVVIDGFEDRAKGRRGCSMDNRGFRVRGTAGASPGRFRPAKKSSG